MDGLQRVGEMSALALHAIAMTAAAGGERKRASELADALHASAHTLRTVMNRLARAGLVDAARGPAGGFRLARPAEDITLAEVVAAVDGESPGCGCLFSRKVCGEGAPCPFATLTGDIEHRVREYFRRTTVRDLAAAMPT